MVYPLEIPPAEDMVLSSSVTAMSRVELQAEAGNTVDWIDRSLHPKSDFALFWLFCCLCFKRDCKAKLNPNEDTAAGNWPGSNLIPILSRITEFGMNPAYDVKRG